MPLDFTISIHYYGIRNPENHLDLFLDPGYEKPIVQYSCKIEDFRKKKKFQMGVPHRRKYLSFSGEISGGRGRVRVLRRGSLEAPERFKDENYPDRITLQLEDEYIIIS